MRFLQRIKEFGEILLWVAYIIFTQGWQALGILVIAILNNKPWECLFILVGFWIGRMFFGTTYHAPTMFACTMLTWIIFYLLIVSVPSFETSITLPAIFGIFLAYILSWINKFLEGSDDDGK